MMMNVLAQATKNVSALKCELRVATPRKENSDLEEAKTE
jgi:hypothetical protein